MTTEQVITLHPTSNKTEYHSDKTDTPVRIQFERMYNQIQENSNQIAAALFGPQALQYQEMLFQATSNALAKDPDETASIIADYIAIPGIVGTVSELILQHREVHPPLETSLGTARTVSYFGRQFGFAGLPKDREVKLLIPSFGKAIITDVNNYPLGSYSIRPDTHSIKNTTLLVSPEEVPLDFTEFVNDLPAFMNDLEQVYPSGTPKMIPLEIQQTLWRYIKFHPQEKQEILEYIRRMGPRGMISILAADVDEAIFIDIVHMANRDNRIGAVETSPNVFEYRPQEGLSPLEEIILEFDALAFDAEVYSKYMRVEAQEQQELKKHILRRATAMLAACASLSRKQEGMIHSEEAAYIIDAFVFERRLLEMNIVELPDKKDPALPYKTVQEYYRFWDKLSPEEHVLFDTVFELWFQHYVRKQRSAPYAGQVEKLKREFYLAYSHMYKDASKTTGDTEQEINRYISSIEHDITEGNIVPLDFSADNPFIVCEFGIGSGERVEKYINNSVRQYMHDCIIYGVDLYKTDSLIDGVEFIEGSIPDAQTLVPKKINRAYVIWSGFSDILLLETQQQTIYSLYNAMAENGILEIDVPCTIGNGSYEEPNQEYHAANPDEPEGMVRVIFENDTVKLATHFNVGPDPLAYVRMFEKAGFECLNIEDIQQFKNYCHQLQKDEVVLNRTDSTIDTNPIWETQAGRKRITYKLRKPTSA